MILESCDIWSQKIFGKNVLGWWTNITRWWGNCLHFDNIYEINEEEYSHYDIDANGDNYSCIVVDIWFSSKVPEFGVGEEAECL